MRYLTGFFRCNLILETTIRAGLYAVLLFGALIYNSYGSPEYWPSDELLWVVEVMLRTHQVDSNFFAYPAGLQIYLTWIGYKIVTAFSVFQDIDRGLLILIGRSISAVFFLSAVFFAEKTVGMINGRCHDIKTIILMGTSCALIHHAHLATAQASLFFGIALSYLAFANVITTGTHCSYYLAALACGIATGAKYPGVYLGMALPVLYVRTFRPTIIGFFAGMVATAFVSGAAVLLTNPFIVLNFSKFKADVLDTAFTEAPAFQSAGSGIVIVLRYTWYYLHAFFTQYAVVPLLVIIGAAVIALRLAAHLKNSGPKEDDALRRIADMILIVSITMVAYLILQTEININQSRYYIPIGIAVALIFSMSVDVLLIALRRSNESGSFEFLRVTGRGLVWLTVICLLGLSVLNGIVHIAVFPLSAKYSAERYIEAALRANPDLSLLRLSYGMRSGAIVDDKVCASRCGVLYLDALPKSREISTWEEYLAAVAQEIKSSRPSMVLAEDIVFNWAIFLPTRYSSEYYRRLEYPNPGPSAWEQIFRKLGYGVQVFPRVAGLDSFRALIGDRYLATIEGVGGPVYLFSRESGNATPLESPIGDQETPRP
jgi:hypothetical protein